MHTTQALPRADAVAPRPATRGRRVVDAPTRMFHWLFALSFVGAFVTADGERWRALHVTLGYLVAGLLVFRVLYGLFGPRHVRFGSMRRRLGGATAWLRSAARWRSIHDVNWRQGENLLMATAIVALLASVIPVTLSGYATYNEWGGDWLEELHEFFGNAFLAVVLLHVGAIVGSSLLRRRNQAQPMITGRVDGPGPDLARRNHAWLAALLLVAAVAFTAWEWRQAPEGLVPATAWGSGSRMHDVHAHRDRHAERD